MTAMKLLKKNMKRKEAYDVKRRNGRAAVQNQAYKIKKVEIADGCYVTFCCPPAGD